MSCPEQAPHLRMGLNRNAASKPYRGIDPLMRLITPGVAPMPVTPLNRTSCPGERAGHEAQHEYGEMSWLDRLDISPWTLAINHKFGLAGPLSLSAVGALLSHDVLGSN